VGAYAELADGHVRLRAEILSEDGRDCIADEGRFTLGDDQAAAELARGMLGRAPESIRKLFA
jgi:hydroxymethylbilane synthase